MATPEANARVERMFKHQLQVEAGLIPEDSPPTFTLPQPLDDRGLPWWFGPDYKPTDRMLQAVAEQNVELAAKLHGDPTAESITDPKAQGSLFD